ncbi:hypothetical protein [Breznakiella homolactica]|uniref:Uncharacterized protein n=1 Tax=Breznakiella homolactica TaxID=2798577 RepID=A0A7T7XMZ6_9SPIR|nr:hypothetical protein [Breznakiella homolactica]QQO09208.1 hypothetical protein JFL75_20130 [Breznakiella homolactica]
MRNFTKILGIIALVAVIGFSLASCATGSSIGGTSDPHGLFTGNSATSNTIDGATELGSYMVILGIVDSGYADYDAAVKAAEAAGKQVFSVTKWYFVFNKTTAYSK